LERPSHHSLPLSCCREISKKRMLFPQRPSCPVRHPPRRNFLKFPLRRQGLHGSLSSILLLSFSPSEGKADTRKCGPAAALFPEYFLHKSNFYMTKKNDSGLATIDRASTYGKVERAYLGGASPAGFPIPTPSRDDTHLYK